MPIAPRLSDSEAAALRSLAERENRSLQDVAREAIREYAENRSRTELLDQILDEELPRYAEALERLGQ
ncbi:ribbon-helix-helix CopG family protein [Haloactinospora alba]|uniref:Ribbon-helix-helix CopG family protein n=1 Tax=Haloactinospora alba TaxID=405555 RepID=A0A543NMD8_9ACTN|nr:ribbon-helix-helix protein, CopG family [Haloactinospora alba]TQN32986.1 ribbon-helix-helix CopG family protein [Haloactinospora alba]